MREIFAHQSIQFDFECPQPCQFASVVGGLFAVCTGNNHAGACSRVAEAVDHNQIAAAAEQQAATADEVSGNIQQVDTAAGLLLQGAQAVSLASQQLQQGSRTLQDNTARFQLD